MGPRRTHGNRFARFRMKLRNLHVFNSGLLDCAQCGKHVATMHEVIMREATDGVALCQSCFELILKNAAQTPENGKIAYDSINDLDEHLAELLFPGGCKDTRSGPLAKQADTAPRSA
jgi:hypothetical protein